VATLHDEIVELPGNQIRWNTYWQMNWPAWPGAVAYELLTLTSEGTAPRPRRLSGCEFRIQVASGANARAEGLATRDMQLLLNSAQLSYRVRAVLDNGRTGEWSRALSVAQPARVTAWNTESLASLSRPIPRAERDP
jgi:hypothetical protein